MVAWRIATLGLILIASALATAARAGGDSAQVVVDDLELMTEPTHSAYSTASLGRGDRVVVLGTEAGWARVQAPAGNFHWINAADVTVQTDGTCVVRRRQATVRYASATARLPGPPWRSIPKGTVVHLIDHPDLKVPGGDPPQVWHAIEASDDKVRFVPLDSLETVNPARVDLKPASPDRPERTVAFDPEADDPDLPPAVNAELASIAAMTRAIKAAPVETWNLDPVRGRYDSLLRQFGSNPEVRATVQPRLDQVHRELELVESARSFARLLREGEARDAEMAQLQKTVAFARSRSERAFDAVGLLQPSSKRSQGQKVLALIGAEGRPIGYLSIPPGVPVNQYLARKVGVRGIVHFDEGLGARLISVRDLELLEPRR